jgi:death-on-curing protein
MTGGEFFPPENLINSGSLEWVLDAIQYPLFGIDHYPTIVEKAAILAWTIIEGHVFFDGCKRTGMSTLDGFLRLNGCSLNASNDEVVEAACEVAKAHTGEGYSYEQFVHWIQE